MTYYSKERCLSLITKHPGMKSKVGTSLKHRPLHKHWKIHRPDLPFDSLSKSKKHFFFFWAFPLKALFPEICHSRVDIDRTQLKKIYRPDLPLDSLSKKAHFFPLSFCSENSHSRAFALSLLQTGPRPKKFYRPDLPFDSLSKNKHFFPLSFSSERSYSPKFDIDRQNLRKKSFRRNSLEGKMCLFLTKNPTIYRVCKFSSIGSCLYQPYGKAQEKSFQS